jgi:hypothetical protein
MNKDLVTKTQAAAKQQKTIDNMLNNKAPFIGTCDEIQEKMFIWDNNFKIIEKIIKYIPCVYFIIEQFFINIVKQKKAFNITKTELEIKEDGEIFLKTNGIVVPIIQFDSIQSTSAIFGRLQDFDLNPLMEDSNFRKYVKNY